MFVHAFLSHMSSVQSPSELVDIGTPSCPQKDVYLYSPLQQQSVALLPSLIVSASYWAPQFFKICLCFLHAIALRKQKRIICLFDRSCCKLWLACGRVWMGLLLSYTTLWTCRGTQGGLVCGWQKALWSLRPKKSWLVCGMVSLSYLNPQLI